LLTFIGEVPFAPSKCGPQTNYDSPIMIVQCSQPMKSLELYLKSPPRYLEEDYTFTLGRGIVVG